MKRFKSLLASTLLLGSSLLLYSCGAGIDHDNSNGTPNIDPGELLNFKDLAPDQKAEQLYSEALAYDQQGKKAKAQLIYKKLAKNYSHTTRAPEALYQIALHNESKNSIQKAFSNYQSLIDNYIGSPLYQPSLDRQIGIAHDAALGRFKEQKLFFRTNLAPSVTDGLIVKVLENAPHAKNAAQTAYIRGQLWDKSGKTETAIQHYRTVTRNYPESSYSADSLYRIGEILYNQSLAGNTNLDNAKYAKETFSELISLYPKHPKALKAKTLNSKVADYNIQRSLEVAQFYEKKEEFTSAAFYYKDVLNSTPKNSESYQIAKARLEALNSPQN